MVGKFTAYLALSQEEVAYGKGDGCVIVVASFLVAGGQFSPHGSAKLPISATLSHAQVISHCDYVAKAVSSQYDPREIYPTGVNFDEDGVQQNWPTLAREGCFCTPVSSYE